MVQESVEITIHPEKAAAFETAMAAAPDLFLKAPGCKAISLMRSVENNGVYRLLIEWETIADHMEGFRNSDAFPKWRALVTPHLDGALSMQHFERVSL